MLKLGLNELQQVRDAASKMGLHHHQNKRIHLARACYDLAYTADVVVALTTVGAAVEAQNESVRGIRPEENGQAKTA